MIINSKLGKQVAVALTQHIKCGNNVAKNMKPQLVIDAE